MSIFSCKRNVDPFLFVNDLPMSRKNSYLIFLTVVCALVLGYAVYRDVRYEKVFSSDLRNRVVGARLEKDGKLPYFYKWKKGDGLRYYDPQAFDSLSVSNITASPFFHQLLYPVADWDEYSLNTWWLIVEYGMLILMTAMALSLAETDRQRGAVWVITCLLLLTDAWKLHVHHGQNYLCIPFFAMAFYFFFRKGASVFGAFLAGTMAIVLVLIRPNAVFLFLPFLFLLPAYGRRYLGIFLLPVFLLTAWTLTNKNERDLWEEYRSSMTGHIKEHQDLQPVLQRNDPDPGYPRWEGVDIAQQDSMRIHSPIKIYSENGNIFVIYESIFHRKIAPSLLILLSCCTILLLMVSYYVCRVKKGDYDPVMAAVLGYSLYMISDLFSPVHRHQYYTVQWIFPLLLIAARIRSPFKAPFLLILAGLLLNISRIDLIRMQHTIGEYLILGVLIWLALYPGMEAPPARVTRENQ